MRTYIQFIISIGLAFLICSNQLPSSPLQATTAGLSATNIIKIDLDTHKLEYFENGRLRFSCTASGGTYQNPSPTGKWPVISIHKSSSPFSHGFISFSTPWHTYRLCKSKTLWALGRINSTNGDIEIYKKDLSVLLSLINADTMIEIIYRNQAFRELKLNTIGADVAKIQRILGMKAIGIFDIETRKKVLHFQKNNTLNATGVVNINTYKMLILKSKLLN